MTKSEVLELEKIQQALIVKQNELKGKPVKRKELKYKQEAIEAYEYCIEALKEFSKK